MFDSVLINVPLSSPLHPQSNIIFLKGFLKQNGYKTKVYDTNIKFINWFLSDTFRHIKDIEYMDNPVRMLALYNEIEKALYDRSAKYRGFSLDIRNVGMAYNRTVFEEVIKSVSDKEANPFIEYYKKFVSEELKPLSPKIVGIGIIFQDQIIPAFTLANIVRDVLPDTKIVLGGQIITRCYDTMTESGLLDRFWDYLVLWDGELPLADIHKTLLDKQPAEMTNVIVKNQSGAVIDRHSYGFDLDSLQRPDIEDIDYNEYLFPEMLIPLQTARGCYGTCEFCAIPFGSNAGFRQRSVEHLIEDILAIRQHTGEKYGKEALYFKFMDDTSAPATLTKLSKEIEIMGLNVQWETFVRLEKAFEDEELMAQLYRGGCRKLMWGLETTDPVILKDMNKKITPVQTTKVLNSTAKAGIMNFVFVLIGFPGETAQQRDALADYIIANQDIHVLTIATFDLTKGSRIQGNLTYPNTYGLEFSRPEGFEVRLPYTVNGGNWKEEMVKEAQRLLVKIIRERPDIGFVSLFPDQVRGILCNRHGNDWGRTFLSRFGEDNIRELLLATERYVSAFEECQEIDLSILPEPLKREHLRTKEDIKSISDAINRRKEYQSRRVNQL
ncbi:MAG: radical SAM protein [Nitrospirae bacterium]|nr:radical SAM protein [Nitrospirota bacterium]MBF0520506.1 radical SAM protein [Nitrospirota bacterium]MBF0535787.1 radical SAM protein [Nitrospirota bacterium]MBF0617672.1 radical SAM protein [Nitrospirota bacterium]